MNFDCILGIVSLVLLVVALVLAVPRITKPHVSWTEDQPVYPRITGTTDDGAYIVQVGDRHYATVSPDQAARWGLLGKQSLK